MSDRTAPEDALASLGDLPLQPTGSGVADLEIAYERMKLAQDAETGSTSAPEGAGLSSSARDGDSSESEAHPS